MRKIKNSKGFTLMEMLIVVAIIAILIAIAIPTFSNSLEKAREAADLANIRSTYAEAMVEAMTENKEVTKTTPAMTQTTAGWSDGTEIPAYLGTVPSVKKGDTLSVKVSADGTVEITGGTVTTE